MGVQSEEAKRKKMDVLMDKLMDISDRIGGEKDRIKPEFKYNGISMANTTPDLKEDNEKDVELNEIEDDKKDIEPNETGSNAKKTKPDGKKIYQDAMNYVEDSGKKDIKQDYLCVKIYENIDIKDVSKESKFTIRISNRDGFYVDIDMFAYRDIVLDNEKSEEDFITSKIEKIIGINSNIDKAGKAICDSLSELCYQKDLQIKRYKELGWDYYNGVRIFKYDKIYCEDSIDIKGECENEVAAGLLNTDDTAEDYENWLVDFSRLMSYSDMDALIIATACTGVVRQLLPYTKENNINVNIVGRRASGKSIISHFALSMFGNPGVLEGSFTDTDNAMEKIRAERLVLPYILDERMLKIEGKSEVSKRHALLMDIFREYEGKVKERLAGAGKELSGQRTYSPIISSSVEPILDKLLEESRDLGQYRRFIELKVEPKDLFYNSRMAETTEEVAYTHYGHGVFLLVNYLINEMKEDKEFVVDTYNDINCIISAILHAVEKKKKLGSKLRSCSKRFALIITTLEFLLKAVNEEGLSEIEVFTESGWISKNLDTKDMEKIRESIENERENRWESSHLGKCVRSYIDGEPLHTKSENILGVLIDNAVEKMKRLGADADIDIYANIVAFIEGHRGKFFEEKKKWDGKGEFAGRLIETEKQYIIQIKVNKGMEWVLVHGGKLKDDELTECIKRLESVTKGGALEALRETFGNVVLGDFEGLILQKYKDKITWHKGEASRGAKNVTLAEIVLEKDIVDTKGMKDSDKKNNEDNEDEVE